MSRILTLVLVLAFFGSPAAAETDELGQPSATGPALLSFVLVEAVYLTGLGAALYHNDNPVARYGATYAAVAGPLVPEIVGAMTGWDGSYLASVLGGLGGSYLVPGLVMVAALTADDVDTFHATAWILASTAGALIVNGVWWSTADPTPEHLEAWRTQEQARRAEEAEQRRARPKTRRKKSGKKTRKPPPPPPPPPPEMRPWLGALPDGRGGLVPSVGLGGRF